jgi:hypothetical protein
MSNILGLLVEYLETLARHERSLANQWRETGPIGEETQQEHDYETAYKDGSHNAYQHCVNIIRDYILDNSS